MRVERALCSDGMHDLAWTTHLRHAVYRRVMQWEPMQPVAPVMKITLLSYSLLSLSA